MRFRLAPLLLAGTLCADLPFVQTLKTGTFSLTGGYTFGQFIDIDQNYGDVGWLYFFETTPDTTILFQDTQFFFMEDGDFCVSAGLGLRQYVEPMKGYLGANLYYDYRTIPHFHPSLNRIGIGMEYLQGRFELRANGYIPVGGAFSRGPEITLDFLDNYKATLRNTEMAFWGGDGELGCWLMDTRRFDFYAAVGGYTYGTYGRGNITKDPIYGGYARARMVWGDVVNFEVRVSGDQVFHGRVEGVVWIQLPFEYLYNKITGSNCYCTSECKRIWTQPVFRHSILAATDCCCVDTFNWETKVK